MRLSTFLAAGGERKYLRYPDPLGVYHSSNLNSDWNLTQENGRYVLYFKNGGATSRMSVPELLNLTLPPIESMVKVGGAVAAHFKRNTYRDDLPLYLVRGHGSYSGAEGQKRRRRGWMVKFNNAYIVYVDNFLARHFFEYTYFASGVESKDIESLARAHLLPFSSGGGQFETKHRLFPSLSHLTSGSKFYLSHLYDINIGDYDIAGQKIAAQVILGDRQTGDFGYGNMRQWDDGLEIRHGKNCRVIERDLSDLEVAFLQASNIRLLSPLNYFPFPKARELSSGSLSGEDAGLRNEVIRTYASLFRDRFDEFVSIVRSPLRFHQERTRFFVRHHEKIVEHRSVRKSGAEALNVGVTGTAASALTSQHHEWALQQNGSAGAHNQTVQRTRYQNPQGVWVEFHPGNEELFKQQAITNRRVYVFKRFEGGESTKCIWRVSKLRQDSDLRWNFDSGHARPRNHPGVVEVYFAIEEDDLPG